ncbi:hypothetical protein KIN20_005849 [Parelaphostrongylus tenuis]|uniref:Uncharacterized protein n=1 Tax=Parelaphostrongylus tenuis TaxID=148309 RepID=A0AAD5QFH0_PARTN|nr:hypothetical protein KIN20_005849 [Parelaphostrongylus tenuis]
MALPPEEYGENTTVLTGVTSEHSYSGDDRPVYDPPMGRVVSRRCFSSIVADRSWLDIRHGASISAPLMCSLPFAIIYLGHHYPEIYCEVDCQGYLLLLGIKTVSAYRCNLGYLLATGGGRPSSRLYFARAALSFFVLFIFVRILVVLHGTDISRTAIVTIPMW